MRRRRAALFTLLLLAGLIAVCGLWLRAQQRQHTVNRELIAALVKGDDQRALSLVKAGADPNTHYKPTPVPSLAELVKQWFHRSVPPANSSPTALMIACGAYWDLETRTLIMQMDRPDNTQLVLAMMLHGANINMKNEDGMTPLGWSVGMIRPKTAAVLLEHGASVNERESDGSTVLMLAVEVPMGRGPSSSEMVQMLLKYGANLTRAG